MAGLGGIGSVHLVAIAWTVFAGAAWGQGGEPDSRGVDLWALANQHAGTLRFSTLFTAQDVRDSLSSPERLDRAMAWCKETGVTHVYLETFRDGYTAQQETLLAAKRRFTGAGFLVSGCVTPVNIGRKAVNGWIFPCFTEQAGLDNLRRIFEYSAGLFDEIMIDDFYATRCECEDCVKARGERAWSEFRCDMLVDVSERYVLGPARKVNPKVQMIIKYPQWYEQFHERGYEVVRESAMFDKIWVGTETRDANHERWGRKSQYEAYFIMRWLGEIGGAKCGGGWFDPYGTSPPTYVEQARQTVLGGARQALLFCYGSLQKDTGPGNVEALRRELPQLFELAELIRGKEVRGVSAPKPPNSDADGNSYVYDFVGLLGVPLVPTAEVRAQVAAAFLPVQALKDPQLSDKLAEMVGAKVPVLVTRQLSEKLPASLQQREGIEVLDVPSDGWKLMDLPADRLRAVRRHLLAPLGVEFEAPTRVALYLFGDDLAVIENFNDSAVETTLKLRAAAGPEVILAIPAGGSLSVAEGAAKAQIPPRSLIVVQFSQ